MKMFLTRLGFGSKMIITGDVTQIDLPKGVESGLITAKRLLTEVQGIVFVYLEESDVVRHPLYTENSTAYDHNDWFISSFRTAKGDIFCWTHLKSFSVCLNTLQDG